jgi:hypothetical protein
MRPSSSHNQPQEDDEEVDIEAMKMNYKRADGSNYVRELPALD